MPIDFFCQSCQTQLRVGDESAGKQARCPRCGQVLQVPEASSVATAAPVATPAAPGPVKSENPYAAPPAGGMAMRVPQSFERQPFVPTSIDAGDIMGRAWRIFADQMGPSLLVTLCYFVLNFMATLLPVVAAVVILVLCLVPEGPPPVVLVWLGLAAALLLVIGLLVAMWLQIGVTIYFLKMARGQDARIGDLFSGGAYLWRFAVVSIAYGLMVVCGTLLCIVPGVYLAVLFWPCIMLVIDRETRVGESFTLAQEATAGNKMQLFFLLLAYMAIMFVAGSVLSLIGQWLVTPYVLLMLTVAYLAMTGQPTLKAND